MTKDKKFLEDGKVRPLQASNAWRILALLFVANTFNFYDRTIPAIVAEPLKLEFSMSDTKLGLLTGAFTIVYAIAGLPLGRLADKMSRGKIMGTGFAAWSLLTAATGAAWNFGSLMLIRLGVGVGEASYAPAANSMIADLFPAKKRARAFGVFQLGLPVGLILAYFTVGSLAEAFDSWRAPFFLAAVPGLLLALCFFVLREPKRGASEAVQVLNTEPVSHPFKRILSKPTMWWLILAGIGANIASYSVNSFSVPLFMRYFGMDLTPASIMVGMVVGVTGLVGLLGGGWVADRALARSVRARALVGAFALLVGAPLTWFALRVGPDSVVVFAAVFGIGWLLQYLYFTSAYPAVAIFFAAFYVLGGATGPLIAGALSDHFAKDAGTPIAGWEGADWAAAYGLRESLTIIVPVALLIGAVGLFLAAKTIIKDNAAMKAEEAAKGSA